MPQDAAFLYPLGEKSGLGIYPSDLLVGGFSGPPGMTVPFLIGTVIVDTAGLPTGGYSVLVDANIDSGISAAGLVGFFEPLSGSGQIFIIEDCGNNVMEGAEECDGTNDAACPGLCSPECTCLPDCNNNGVPDADDIGPGSTGRKLYWMTWSTPSIGRTNLDGSDQDNLITGLGRPWDIALDPVGGKMYYTRPLNGPLI